MNAPKTQANNPAKRGEYASNKVCFGEFNRYCVYAVHTRFSDVQWFVTDAEKLVTVGMLEMPDVIRQADSFDEAVNGLSEAHA